MDRELFIKNMLQKTINMTPKGFVSDELSNSDFKKMYRVFFENILEISKADITNVSGYGEINEECQTEYKTLREFLVGTFSEENVGYWYNWKEMFETTVLDENDFYKFYKKMEENIEFCEGRRFLVNNNTFFVNMITDGRNTVGFPDWSRAAICDLTLDIAIMDLNKPYLQIPELFISYCIETGIDIPNFKERLLCMGYYKGIDTLRWHASIDDKKFCDSIVTYLNELEERFNLIK